MVLLSYLQLALPSVNVVRGLVQLLQLPLFTVNTACHIKTGRKRHRKEVCIDTFHISLNFFFLNAYNLTCVLTSGSLTFFFFFFNPGGKIKENLTWILGSTSSSSSAHCDSSSFSKGSIFRGSWVVFLGWGGVEAADTAQTKQHPWALDRQGRPAAVLPHRPLRCMALVFKRFGIRLHESKGSAVCRILSRGGITSWMSPSRTDNSLT